MERYRDGLLGHIQRDVLYVPLQHRRLGIRNGEYVSIAPSSADVGSFDCVHADAYAFHEGELHLPSTKERDDGSGPLTPERGGVDAVSGQSMETAVADHAVLRQSAMQDETTKTRRKKMDTWVVLVHGFGGSATQMQRLALSLLQPAVSGRFISPLQCSHRIHGCLSN